MTSSNDSLITYWQKLAAILPCIAASLAISLSYILDVSWDRDDCVAVLLFISFPLVVGFVLIRLGKVPAFAGFVAISGLIMAYSMIEAALALLGVRSPAPIADAWLAAADELLPLTATDIVIGTRQMPEWAIWALSKAYVQTGPYLYVSLIVLLVTDREAAAWRLFLIWGGSFLTISLMAFSAPALGCFSQLTPDQVDHLPKGAGRYAIRTFQEFRNATEPVLSLGHVSGVITFPSFHTACALILAQAWHGTRIFGVLAKMLTGVIIFSCVPMGGHYLVDLIAGAAVWWGVTLAIDHLGKKRVAQRLNAAIAVSPA